MLSRVPVRLSAPLAIAVLWSAPVCATDIPVPAQEVSLAGLSIGAKKPLRVGLQIPAAVENSVFSGAPSTPGKTGDNKEVGRDGHFIIPMGRMLKSGCLDGMSRAFDTVTVFGAGSGPAAAGAVVVPKVSHFQFWFTTQGRAPFGERWTAYAKATVKLSVLDRNGVQVWSRDAEAQGMDGVVCKPANRSDLAAAVGQATALALASALQAGIEEMVSAPEVASLWGAGQRRQPAVVSSSLPAATCSSATANIAVLDLLGSGPTKDELLSLSSRLCSELFRTGCYTVLERGEMAGILKEQAFQQSGCTSTECMVEAGRLLSVRYMVGGNVGRVGELYSLDLRMIDVGSGKIAAIASQDVSGGIEQVVTVGLRECVAALVRGRK
jgi:hypothetical protein